MPCSPFCLLRTPVCGLESPTVGMSLPPQLIQFRSFLPAMARERLIQLIVGSNHHRDQLVSCFKTTTTTKFTSLVKSFMALSALEDYSILQLPQAWKGLASCHQYTWLPFQPLGLVSQYTSSLKLQASQPTLLMLRTRVYALGSWPPKWSTSSFHYKI